MQIVRDLTVRHRRKDILHGIGFTAHAGAVTAIVGPSGAGKSTLLKAMTGDQQYRGDIHLDGHDIAQTPLHRLARYRAVLPQATPLAFPFTVIEVVRMGLINTPGDHVAQAALAQVGLARFGARFYQGPSGGEQQRVQLARVLTQVWHPVGDDGTPRWLFLDEPVSSLDIGHQLQVMDLIRDFAARGGGVVMAMHDLNLTAMSADRVALLCGGRIVKQGKPAEVFTDDLLGRAYGCDLFANRAPDGCAYVLPQVAGRSRPRFQPGCTQTR